MVKERWNLACLMEEMMLNTMVMALSRYPNYLGCRMNISLERYYLKQYSDYCCVWEEQQLTDPTAVFRRQM